MRNISLLITIIALALSSGCSTAATHPGIPGHDISHPATTSSHYIQGLWQFIANPDSETLEATPLRNGGMHLNALPFLEPPPLVNLTIESLEFNGDIVEVDIGLTHPFQGLNQFTGFDVCGIFITKGTISGFTDPALVMAGQGDTRLLNPDGYSRWWNPIEFPVNEGTMFSYNDGLLGTPHSTANYNSTLNAYKYYADSLGANSGLDTLNPMGRGVFTPGKKNIRHYTIELGAGLIFNYAIDANWKFPQGTPPWNIEDFGEKANRPEAWYVDIEITENTLYNNGANSGGDLSLIIDVYDHFNTSLNTVYIESPTNFDEVSSAVPTGGGIGFSTYEIEITNATPAEGEIELLIAVESEVVGYGGNLPVEYVTAYFTETIPVADEYPLEGIFVDGDNAGDLLMDGTQAHPFDTIQKGLDAAFYSSNETVYIDQCVDNYDPFTVHNNSHMAGVNWNGGIGWAMVVQIDMWNYSHQVVNVTIEGLHFDITRNQMPGPIVTDHIGMQFGSVNGLTITGCKFTGLITNQLHSWYTRFISVSNLEISYCEFTDIFRRGPADSNRSFLVLYVTQSSNVSIHHCEFHHIGFDIPDAGSQPTTTTAIRCGPFIQSLDIHNVLIYDIFDKTDGVGTYVVGMNNMRGIQCIWEDGSYFNIYNITVDDLRHADPPESTDVNSGNIYGIYMAAPHVERNWKNNIVSNLIPTDETVIPEYTAFWGYWCEGECIPGPSPQPMDYSAAFNVGMPLPPGEDSSDGWYYGWEDQVTWGTGCIFNYENSDPAYDMTPGPNFYHPTNPDYAYGADDGSEMGAFGGPYGDWTPPSQE